MMNNKIILYFLMSVLFISSCSVNETDTTQIDKSVTTASIVAMVEQYGLTNVIDIESISETLSLEEIEALLRDASQAHTKHVKFHELYTQLTQELNSAYDNGDSDLYEQKRRELNSIKSDIIKSLPSYIRDQMAQELSDKKNVAEKYLQELKVAKSYKDSLQLSNKYGFSLPAKGQNQSTIMPIKIKHYNLEN